MGYDKYIDEIFKILKDKIDIKIELDKSNEEDYFKFYYNSYNYSLNKAFFLMRYYKNLQIEDVVDEVYIMIESTKLGEE